MPDGIQVGDTATNSQTGKKIQWDGKTWVPLSEPSAWSRVSKGFKEYVTDPAKQIGTEAYERGQRTQPGSGYSGAAMELPGTIIDAILGGQSEQMGRLAETQQAFEKKPTLKGAGDTLAEGAFSIPLVGPLARDFLATPDPYEMIGKAAGIITGEKLPKIGEAAHGVADLSSRGLRSSAQELLLPGEHEVGEARAAHETTQANQLSDFFNKAEQTRQQNERDLMSARSEHEKDLARLDQEYQEQVQKAGKETAEDEAQYKAKVEQAKDEYARKIAERNQKAIAQSSKQSAATLREDTFATKNKSGPAYKRLTQMADSVADSVNKLDKTVREAYNARWNAWRMAMGDAEGNFEPVQQAVVNAENNILKGSPENIKIFRDILAEGEDPLLSQASVFKGAGRGVDLKEVLSSMKSEGERNRFLRGLQDEGVSLEADRGVKAGATLPIDQIQGYSTELGNKLYRGGNIAGDIRRALKSVKDAADKEVERVSDSKGQGSIYRQNKRDWSQYMDDFYDHDGPLYKMKNAVNSDRRLALMYGSEGGRVIGSLGRYSRFDPGIQFSGEKVSSPNLVGRVRSLVSQLDAMPSSAGTVPGRVPRPGFPERPAPTEVPARPTGPESVRIHPRAMPERPVTSPFSAEEFQKRAFRKSVDKFRKFGWDDKGAIMGGMIELFTGRPPYALSYPVLKRVIGKVLGSEQFENWLIQNKPQEIARVSSIVSNPRADTAQRAVAQAELEILQGRVQ